MAQPPKKGKKLTPAEQKKLADGIALFKTTYADVLSVWYEATETQKLTYLQNSPLLFELLEWSERWK